TAVSASQAQEPGDAVSFSLLEFTGRALDGPFDSTRYYFSLPANWELTVGAEVQLDLVVFPADGGPAVQSGVFGGFLDVSFNDVQRCAAGRHHAQPGRAANPHPGKSGGGAGSPRRR
ncbi:MAG: hypothetical protein ACE5G8_13880, partial [Anaerolineae bacterium]